MARNTIVFEIFIGRFCGVVTVVTFDREGWPWEPAETILLVLKSEVLLSEFLISVSDMV